MLWRIPRRINRCGAYRVIVAVATQVPGLASIACNVDFRRTESHQLKRSVIYAKQFPHLNPLPVSCLQTDLTITMHWFQVGKVPSGSPFAFVKVRHIHSIREITIPHIPVLITRKLGIEQTYPPKHRKVHVVCTLEHTTSFSALLAKRKPAVLF